MRGKGIRLGRECAGQGITPAYAGKSSRLPFIPTSFRDHPRLCGEKDKKIGGKKYRVGSPPPMRGKVQSAVQRHVYNRITPAYAGKSKNW